MRETYTSRRCFGGCFVCGGSEAMWHANNAQAVAARHHDATGHATWADVALSISYGRAQEGPDPNQERDGKDQTMAEPIWRVVAQFGNGFLTVSSTHSAPDEDTAIDILKAAQAMNYRNADWVRAYEITRAEAMALRTDPASADGAGGASSE